MIKLAFFKVVVIILLVFANSVFLNADNLLWINFSDKDDDIDVHAAFRGTVHLKKKTDITIQISGATSYSLFVDGDFITDGPDRFSPEYPVYQKCELTLDKGTHVLAVQVHSAGVETRILANIAPFLYCRMFSGNEEIEPEWKATQLTGYLKGFKRISPQLNWLEWNDTRNNPSDWKLLTFDDCEWEKPISVNRPIGSMEPSDISPIKNISINFEEIGNGPVANFFGYEKDDPSARFFLRDLQCEDFPSQGIWKRYDLGRIRLSRPKFVMDLPEGTVVQFAFSEYLRHDRVMPWINLSLDETFNMVHFVARGGEQEFFPFTPLGGRFVEIHVIAPEENIKIIDEQFVERRYYNEPGGTFVSDDDMINRIWTLGVDTYMSCAEDALVDNPTRERGQWMGDIVVGLRIGASAFSDLKIVKKGLYQQAQCARDDGLVAGLSPGNKAYLSTFSALWTGACIDYYKTTGDKSVLTDLYSYSEKNIAAFESHKTPFGISDDAGWAFVDWGYVRNDGEADMGLNLMYYDALIDMVEWSEILKFHEKARYYRDLAEDMEAIISKWYKPFFKQSKIDWKTIGYHRTVLGMKYGFVPKKLHAEAIDYMKNHINSCFPNNPEAPRLSDPNANNPQLITPYFANYAFPLLIENGEAEFALEQYKSCWGWMLEQGTTTCLEVFDIRWSHCHGWAGSPTWQLSRYFLGLHSDYSESEKAYTLNLKTGNLKKAEGSIPLPEGGLISVKWEKEGDKVNYSIHSPVQITLNVKDAKRYGLKSQYMVDGNFKIKLSNY